MSDVSIATIRSMLQDRVDAVVRELVPGGFMRAGLYEAPNPTRGDKKAGSFKIYMRGATAGKWVDYAGVNAPFVAGGDRGDVIDLIAYVQYGEFPRAEARKKAIGWAKDFLGLATLSSAERERLTKLAHQRKLAAASREKDERARKERRAFELWLKAKPGLGGTPAGHYLLMRGIDLLDVATFEANDIRFLPELEYVQGATWEEQGGRRVKVAPGPSHPAIVSALRDRHGNVTGVHCTYLHTDPEQPADKAFAKIMFGTVAGSVLRITRGAGDVAVEGVSEQAHLDDLPPTIICEGLEDGLTLALTAPEARVWAATSLGNLGNVYVDHPCVGDVIVARDNDWQSPQAVRQFEHGIALLEGHGKPISQMAAIAGKDFNDLWRL